MRIAGRLARARWFVSALLALSRPRRFLVLTYHRVNDSRHPFFGGTRVALFREQMRLLRDHFSVLPLFELVERAQASELPPNGVAVTFDDGYRDNYERAFPILSELSLPATIFLVTDALDNNEMIWHDRVFDAFHRTARGELTFEGTVLGLSSFEDKEKALRTVLRSVRGTSPDERRAIVGTVVDQLKVSPPNDASWDKLSWDEVREMYAGGIRFGAHTLDHPILSHVDSNEARRQIRGSKARIEEELDQTVTEFAYPNGSAVDFNQDTMRILAEEGFRSAVTTIGGGNDGQSDPMVLRRVGMWGDDPHLSVLRLARIRLDA